LRVRGLERTDVVEAIGAATKLHDHAGKCQLSGIERDAIFWDCTARHEQLTETRRPVQPRRDLCRSDLPQDGLRKIGRRERVAQDRFAVRVHHLCDEAFCGRDGGSNLRESLIDTLQRNLCVGRGREVDKELGRSLTRCRNDIAHAGQRFERLVQRPGDRDAHPIRRQIARIRDDVDTREIHRRKYALRGDEIRANAEQRENQNDEDDQLIVAQCEPGEHHRSVAGGR
jgi:hypothetical protein